MALFLTREEVRAVLTDMPEIIDAVEGALVQSSLGRTVQPVRLRIFVPKYESRIVTMTGYLEATEVMGTKVIGGAAANRDRGLLGLMAVILLCDAVTGKFLALMDGSYITDVRTAAASAVATRHLALPEASVLGMLGAGVQARGHLWAISKVRPIRRVKVCARTREHSLRYKAEMEARHGLPVEVCDTAEAVVRDSDVVVTATSSKTPVLRGAWLKKGAHVNAVGRPTPNTREMDSDAVCGAKLVTDSLEALFAEAGEVLIPIAEGRMVREQVYGEIGEIAAGLKPGRVDPGEITVFKSGGIAAEDLVTAKLAYDRARERGLGLELPI